MQANRVRGSKKLKREEVIGDIIRNNPECRELYNDYEQIRDITSLEKIGSYVQLALSIASRYY